ncbi:MAG: hypothetical protein ACYS0D_14735, partial [Planctomycetota bacterium]
STIAEFYVEDDAILLELEIGPEDLQAFRNLFPDEIYERLGHAPRPATERLLEFFEQDLVVGFEGGAPLRGRILEMDSRPRVRRDEITGEPLPPAADETANVIFARIVYTLSGRPAVLNLGGTLPAEAGLGFVVYHGGIAVNDFRYLGPSQKLELDWDDPWYTRFAARALRRAYSAPMSGFIYVEPYEVRKEIIVRPKDLQRWIDLGLEGRGTIPASMQQEITRQVGEFLRRHQPVTVDGETITPELARVNFLERTLKTSRVIDPPVDLDVDAAILGAIFVYPTDGLARHVTMEWDLFDERIRQVAAAAVDPLGPMPALLEPDYAVLEWQNFIKIPVMPTLTDLRSPPSAVARSLLAARWMLAGLSVILLWRLVAAFRKGARCRTGLAAAVILSVLATATAAWASREARLSSSATREVVAGLLHNIYRAFDYRQEEQIYDVLARSVDGELLTRIYLETRRGLELANQGGARAKVKEIELTEIDAKFVEAGGIAAVATWTVSGSVGHWGHVHQRRNQYRAELTVRALDGAWKLTEIEILQEERL